MTRTFAWARGAHPTGLMVMHAPHDDTVDIANAERIFALARYPKGFVSLDGMDHLVTGREDAAQVAATIAAWSARYIGKA